MWVGGGGKYLEENERSTRVGIIRRNGGTFRPNLLQTSLENINRRNPYYGIRKLILIFTDPRPKGGHWDLSVPI